MKTQLHPRVEQLDRRFLLSASIADWNRESMCNMYIDKFFGARTHEIPRPPKIFRMSARASFRPKPKYTGGPMAAKPMQRMRLVKRPLLHPKEIAMTTPITPDAPTKPYWPISAPKAILTPAEEAISLVADRFAALAEGFYYSHD
jgi:hypothetical protein